MEEGYKDRMAAPPKRRRGRPPKNQTRDEERQAIPAEVPGAVFPMICPHCHRGMQPTVLRTRENGVRDLRCKQCGRDFEFTPAKVRRK